MKHLSPLRYPGGKTVLTKFIGNIAAGVGARTYVEPFAGGAGAAVRMLVDEYVDEIIIGDINRGLIEFWRSVFWRTEWFLDEVARIDVTIEEWHRQREIYVDPSADPAALGLATFFLNRTNRSGILDARPIGGLDQNGKWKIDARFNKEELCRRIAVLSRYRNRVAVRHSHASDLLIELATAADGLVIYADPPYLTKSQDLYVDLCSWDDHLALSEMLRYLYPNWLVTYDAEPRVGSVLFPESAIARYSLAHTAGPQRIGIELAVFSDSVSAVVGLEDLGPRGGSWVREPGVRAVELVTSSPIPV